MIRVSEIQDNFYGAGKTVVGLRQPLTPAYAVLDAVNTYSLSGQYYDSGLVNAKNIHDMQEYPDISDNDFNTLLSQLIKESYINALNLAFSGNDRIEGGLLFKNVKYNKNPIDLPAGFVGLELNVLQNQNATVTINNIITEFEGSGTITLYLFSSEKKTPLQSKTLTITDSTTTVTALNWNLTEHKNVGGNYFIGYLTSGLSLKPFSRDAGNSYFRTNYQNLSARNIKVDNITTAEVFDIEDIEYQNETYGLNLDITVQTDYTDYIIDNKLSLIDLLRYQFQADVLRLFISSTRSNDDERLIMKRSVRELEGVLTEQGGVYSQGILRKLENEAKKVYKAYVNQDEGLTIGRIL